METTTKEATMFPLDTANSRAARMMAAGQVTVTFTSEATGQHITLLAKARGKDAEDKWTGCPLADALVVFIEVPNQGGWNDKVGKVTRSAGFTPDRNADPARTFCAKHLLRWLAGEDLPTGLTAEESNHCGRCGRELTDPVSIARGIGPTCLGAETGSTHQTKTRGEFDTAAGEPATVATGTAGQIAKAFAPAWNGLPKPSPRDADFEGRMAQLAAAASSMGDTPIGSYDHGYDDAAEAEYNAAYQAAEIALDQAAEESKLAAEEQANRTTVATDKQGVPLAVGDWRARKRYAKAARDEDRKEKLAKPSSQNKIQEATGDCIPY